MILTDNLFGDIITDEAGAVVGGVGYSASGCINASNEYPSMFEPIHGSAPDIAGQNKANPTAAILSAAMLLRRLGFDDAAAKIDAAVEADIRRLGSTTHSTDEVGHDILSACDWHSLTFHLDVPFGETPAETRFSLERWASSCQGIFQGFSGFVPVVNAR